MKIPFMNLGATNLQVHSEIMNKLEELILDNQFIGGDEIRLFEEEFCQFCGVKNVVGCSNGTSALMLALKAVGVNPGDKVICPVNSFVATAEAITTIGAETIFVDIGVDACMCIDHLERALEANDGVKAVVPVHLYGQQVNMPEVMKLSKKFGFRVVEDAAQAHGSLFHDKKPGQWGDAACFSFYPGKNLGAMGDAGAVVCQDEAIANSVRRLANHGRDLGKKYQHSVVGFNARLDSIQAAILRIKLQKLPQLTELRRKNANILLNQLKDSHLTLPIVNEFSNPAWHLFVIQVDDRDNFKQKIADRGVSTGIHYPFPLHLLDAYDYLGFQHGDFPVAETAAKKSLSLPFWPEMSQEQLEYVVNVIDECL